MVYKVKVCDRFNTIEWETEEPNTEECQRMYEVLRAMCIDETSVVTKTVTKTEHKKKPASDKQKLLLRQKKIPYDQDITAQEAFLLLQKYEKVYPDKTII